MTKPLSLDTRKKLLRAVANGEFNQADFPELLSLKAPEGNNADLSRLSTIEKAMLMALIRKLRGSEHQGGSIESEESAVNKAAQLFGRLANRNAL